MLKRRVTNGLQEETTESCGNVQLVHQRLLQLEEDGYSTSPKSRAAPQQAEQPKLGSRKSGSMAAKTQKDEKIKDPFQDWKKNVLDPNRMTWTQKQMQTFEGIKDLQGELKKAGIDFKQLTLKELDDERLNDNRTLFSEAGMRATERTQKRLQAAMQGAWYTKEEPHDKKEARRDLYAHYGVNHSSSEPALRPALRVFKESQERVRRTLGTPGLGRLLAMDQN